MDLAQQKNVLSPLGKMAIKHRASIYADDVIIFIKPLLQDFNDV